VKCGAFWNEVRDGDATLRVDAQVGGLSLIDFTSADSVSTTGTVPTSK
jgi:hypothetical protein